MDLEYINKIKELEQKLVKKDEEIKILKDKTYDEVSKNGHVYVLKCDGPGYKIGKTKDSVEKRIKGLQTGNVNNIEIMFDCETNNADLLEKCVHDILYKYRSKSNREFFDCDLQYIIMIIEYTNTTFNTMKSTYQNISKEELHHIYNSKIQEIKVKYQIEDYYEELEDDYETRQILRENISYSDNKKDYVKLKDIKLLLKENNITHTKEILINIVKLLFPESDFYDRKQLNRKDTLNVFTNLKRI